MPFATGPWHTPPKLPDDSAELCLVLLMGSGMHHRYEAMRYAEGNWRYQSGDLLDPACWISRWAYITSSVQHMAEVPPPREPPVESRLFVQGHITEEENVRLLVGYIAELKAQLATVRSAYDALSERKATVRQLQGNLVALENERVAQLAARDKKHEVRYAKLLAELNALKKAGSNERQLQSRLVALENERAAQLAARDRQHEAKVAKLQEELNALKHTKPTDRHLQSRLVALENQRVAQLAARDQRFQAKCAQLEEALKKIARLERTVQKAQLHHHAPAATHPLTDPAP